MNTSLSGRKTPVDHGVQIRFINDLGERGGVQPVPLPKARPQPHSKYGVAVRVQGIAGQPYVVLKDGQKGDSYGVQLKTHYHSGHGSLPRRKDRGEAGSYGTLVGEGGVQGGALRRAQSHGSLLDRDGEGGLGREELQLSRPPGDGKSGSYGNLDSGIGLRGERERERGVAWGDHERDMDERNAWGGTYNNAGPNGSERSAPFHPEQQQQPRRTPVNRLVNRFDSRGQHREEDQRAASLALAPNPYTSPPSPNRHHGNAAGLNRPSPPRKTTPAELQRRSDAQVRTPFLLFYPMHSRCIVACMSGMCDLCLKVTPDLLLDQGPNAGTSSSEEEEEEALRQAIYSILRQGFAPASCH